MTAYELQRANLCGPPLHNACGAASINRHAGPNPTALNTGSPATEHASSPWASQRQWQGLQHSRLPGVAGETPPPSSHVATEAPE
jgi:hypothetical protein